MKLVKINSENTVMPSEVSRVSVDTYGRGVHVHMRDGTALWVDRHYNCSAYETKDALEKQINEALQ